MNNAQGGSGFSEAEGVWFLCIGRMEVGEYRIGPRRENKKEKICIRKQIYILVEKS
jgi:hypothetical protein